MNKILREHINNGYFVKVEKIPRLTGLKVTFPENMLYDKDNDHFWKIYESGKGVLTIYKNGEVLERFKIPKYAHRSIVMCDMLYTCKKYNISTDLIVIYENNLPTDGKFNVKKLLKIKESQKELEVATLLEMLVSQADAKNYVKKHDLENVQDIFNSIIEVGGL